MTLQKSVLQFTYMSKATITVENQEKGFSIVVSTHEPYPTVLITRDHAKQETTFQVSLSDTNALIETDYKTIYQELKDERAARDFLQVAYLVYRQLMAQYESEIEQLIDEILSM